MHYASGTMIRAAALFAAALCFLAPRSARADLIQNGDFSSPGTSGQLTVNTTLTDWTGGGKEGGFGSQTTPPVFVFPATGGSVTGDAFMGSVSYYGNPMSPDGGRFIGADGDPAWAGSISQTVNGLTVGDTYTLTFNWAGAQQTGFSGDTTEKWQVSFGSATQNTATVSTPSQTFVGWQSATMTFTATSASQVLQFLAMGSPSGQPPWLLLDGVSMTDTSLAAVPEPSTLALAGISGLALVGGGLRARLRKAKKNPA